MLKIYILKIKLLAFGIFTDILGKNSLEISLENSMTVGDLKDYIGKKYPKTKGLNFAVAIDETYATDATLINESNVVALIPPVSGG